MKNIKIKILKYPSGLEENAKESNLVTEAGEGTTATQRSRSRLPSRTSGSNYRERSSERGISSKPQADATGAPAKSTQADVDSATRESDELTVDLSGLSSSDKTPAEESNMPDGANEVRGRLQYSQAADEAPETDSEDEAGAAEEDADDIAKLMGFGGFGSTKGKQVKGAKGGGAKKEKKTQYRQYMNRAKGFNRPLSPTRE